MRFAIHLRNETPEVQEFSDRLTDEIVGAGGSVVEEGAEPDLVLAVGGDGTVLAAATRALEWDVPILGFNLGTLGFLSEAEPEEMATTVDRLIRGDFEVEERLTVRADVGDNHAVGLNDVVVEKVDSTRLISFRVVIDGVEFATYRADGLITATPTGSTAYSFSAGGPIVDRDVDALVLTPVASHSLFDRAIVLPASSVIDVTVLTDRAVRVNVDKLGLGQVAEGQTVRITRGERGVKFATFGGSTFPGLVRSKFDLQ